MPEFISPSDLMFTNFEPQVSNRFQMYIDGVPTFIIKMADKPNVSFGDIVIDHINVKRKLKGKADWGDISITLWDPISPSGGQVAMEWIRLSHESLTGRDGYADFYKKNITLIQVGPPGDITQKWIIYGAYIASSNFGSLDMADDQPVMIALTLKMDFCELEF